MSKTPLTRSPRLRTAAAVKADAQLLAGESSRVARAATDDTSTPPEQTGVVVGELWLYGVVGGYWFGFDADSVAEALRKLDVDVLYVRIHSPGGRASDGIAIGNLFRNHRAKVVIVVDGLAASAASVIAIAGDEIVMCPGSQMMLHDASMWTGGNAAQLRRDADWIDGQSNNYASVYALRGGGTPEQWRAVMLANDGEGTWYTADDAVAAGLADEVGTRVATGSPPTAPADQIDEHDDDLLARIEHDLVLLERDVHPAARAAWQGARPKPPTASADGTTHTEGGSAVALSNEQITMRQKLGIAEDADEATFLAALDEALEERSDPPAAPAQATAAFTPPEGMVLVEEDVLASLREQGQQGAAARQQQLDEKRDRTIAQAITAGKITPARKEHFEAAWKADAEGTEQLLASLAPGLVPVTERGHDQQSTVAASAYDELYGSKGA